MKAASRKGFTLIEILIVVIILGILAAIVIPQFTNAAQDAKMSAVRSTVQSVRGQVSLFALQHGDNMPAFWSDLTGTTTFDGKTWGPYMQSVPVNPFNQATAVGSDTTGSTNGWSLLNKRFYGYASYNGASTWVGDN